MPKSVFSKSAIARFLEGSPHPAYLLDGRRRIVWANAALVQWCGVTAESLLHETCDYHLDATTPLQVTLNGLCPPPTVYDGVLLTATLHCQFGDPMKREGTFLPILNQERTVVAVFVLADMALPSRPTSPSLLDSQLATEIHDALAELRTARTEGCPFGNLVGNSPAIRRVRAQMLAAIQTPSRVVVHGPPGTDRETIVRLIHLGRHREAAASIIPLACPLLDAELLRTTITAFIQQLAELEAEAPPSLLLLDVDRLPRDAQLELEGFLAIEELELRTLATASESLVHLSRTDAFRHDLAQALSVIPIEIPPLALRKEDVPATAQQFLEETNTRRTRQLAGFSAEALDQLAAFPWPRNEDELRQVVLGCAERTRGSIIEVDELPKEIRLGLDAVVYPPVAPTVIDLENVLQDVERRLIHEALTESGMNKAEAARRLNISRNKLLRRLDQLGMRDVENA